MYSNVFMAASGSDVIKRSLEAAAAFVSSTAAGQQGDSDWLKQELARSGEWDWPRRSQKLSP